MSDESEALQYRRRFLICCAPGGPARMLHYLVTYVRDTLDRESLGAISSATGADREGPGTPGPERRIHLHPAAHADNGTATSERKADADVAGTPKPNSDSMIDKHIDRERAPPHSGFMTLVVIWSSLSVTGLVGCACFHREKADANVVAARQLSLRGMDALQRGRWDDAENLFASALQKNPADERAHRHFAEVMWHRGEQQTAIRHQEKCVRLSGGDPSLLVQLGEMYLTQGNVDAASECANEAIDTNTQLSGAWALRGDIYRRRGEPNEAMECYHRALSYEPRYPHVQLALADLYRQDNRPRRALATLSALAGQYPPDEVPQEIEFQRGLALKALGRYQDAVETLASATRRSEPNADLLYHLSEAQFLAGNAASARLAVQAALAKAPTHTASLALRDKLERHSQSMTAAVERK